MQILDFSKVIVEETEWFQFRLGKGADFARALERFKKLIPLVDRCYIEEQDHLWRVKVEVANQPHIAAALGEIFSNWQGCVEQVRRQMVLPGF